MKSPILNSSGYNYVRERVTQKRAPFPGSLSTHARPEWVVAIFRTLRTNSENRRGSGIGLAIVRKIATTHSGRAWVESEPGHGALFCVTLSRT